MARYRWRLYIASLSNNKHMKNEIILTPSFQEKIKGNNYRSHLNIIQKLVKKLESMGKNALKILDVEKNYLLCEMKVMRPPYRLYVIVEQKENKYYIVDWEHKDNQEKIINELKGKLGLALEFSLDKIFT